MLMTTFLASCAVELENPFPRPDPFVIEGLLEELEFTGYAAIESQSGNAAQKRLMAVRASKLDAYRLAAEYVYGIYLDSDTTIGSLAVAEDEFRARVEGVIFGAELVSVEPISEDTYATTVALTQEQIDIIRREYVRSL
tara:strand:- start:2849 stop:3265 length:417 start_codon:yes stop_codon:yes gene_type:complete